MNIFGSWNRDENLAFQKRLDALSSPVAARNLYLDYLKKSPTDMESAMSEVIGTITNQIDDAKISRRGINACVAKLEAQDFLIARLFRKVIFFLFRYQTIYAKKCEAIHQLKQKNDTSLAHLKTYNRLLVELPIVIDVLEQWSSLDHCPEKDTYNRIQPVKQLRRLKRLLRTLDIQGESKFSKEIQIAEKHFADITKKFFTDPSLQPLAQNVHVNSVQAQPKGISNEENTCYLASVLQVIRAIPQFRNLIENEEVLDIIYDPEKDLIKDINPLKDAIRDFLMMMSVPETGTSIHGVHQAIRTKLKELGLIDRLKGQCDSSELLIKLMDLLGYRFQTTMYCTSTLTEIQDISELGDNPSSRENIEYERQEDPLFSLPIQLCASEENQAHDLSTVLTETGLITEAVAAFYEEVDGVRQPKIGKRRQEYSFSDVLPDVIPIVRKRTAELDVPFGSVPLSFFPAGKERESYVLMATIHHEGDPYSGHYYAYVRKDEETFYRCDDSTISEVNVRDNPRELTGELIYFYMKESRN